MLVFTIQYLIFPERMSCCKTGNSWRKATGSFRTRRQVAEASRPAGFGIAYTNMSSVGFYKTTFQVPKNIVLNIPTVKYDWVIQLLWDKNRILCCIKQHNSDLNDDIFSYEVTSHMHGSVWRHFDWIGGTSFNVCKRNRLVKSQQLLWPVQRTSDWTIFLPA